MKYLYCLGFGAGVAAFVYSRMARRVGYGNTQSIVTVVAVVFVIATIFFFTLTSLLGIH